MIPQIQPWIDDSEWQEVKRVMESTYLTENQVTEEFEAGIKALTGAKHAIAVCNGTAALYCILKALNIGHGDEVIVPNLTFVASSNAVIMAGAKPVFCPVRADTLCIDVEAAAALVNDKTKGIMPVHLYGQSADMDAVLAFAKRFELKVIEDAAQAIGVEFTIVMSAITETQVPFPSMATKRLPVVKVELFSPTVILLPRLAVGLRIMGDRVAAPLSMNILALIFP